MANRFPLVLDTTDGNKIKELPADDNLNLRENSIVNVQDITALGTIDAGDIRVAGNRLVAQAFADLTDTPSSFVGSSNYFVKVNADGNGLEYRPLSDLGNIEIDTITVNQNITPSSDNVVWIGTDTEKVQQVTAYTLKGNLTAYDDTIVFNATTGKISYAALQGAPTFLSEFTNDVGYLRTVDLNDQLAGLFDEGQQFVTDIQGSVFGDDSSVLVDSVNSIITGDVLNTSVDTATLTASQVTSSTVTAQIFEGPAAGDMQIDAGASGVINIGTGAGTTEVNIEKATLDTFDQGSGLGVAQITAYTDLDIDAGNRVKISSTAPFRFAHVTSTEQLAIGAQEGDVVYNTTTARLQMYQGGTWKDVNGNVEATTGQSDFNDVVIAGNLTVSGTTTTVDTANTTIKDNVITLNEGEAGAGVTAGTSGIEIDRGSESNKTLVWDDSVDKWTVGAETVVAATFEGSLLGDVVASDIEIDGATSRLTFDSLTAPEIRNGDGSVRVVLFGDDYSPGTAQLYVEANNVWLYSDLLVEQNAVIKGAVTAAAFKGTFVGDDSTILVDGVAGKIVGDIENAEVVTTTVQGRDGAALNIYRGTNGTVTVGDNSSGSVTVNDSGINITSTAGVDIDGAVGGTVDIGTGATTGNVTIGKVGRTTTINGTFNATLTGNVVGDVTGDVTGNIDNTALTIGATDATSIAIGNASSTTTINGTVSLPALIAGEITADDSISITTATGDGNAISIGPGGTNTFVNVTADNIRFFGPVTNSINAQGGIVGDVKGTITGDDSTILVDAVNSVIPYSVLDGAPTALSQFSNDLDYAAIIGTQLTVQGLPVDTLMTGTLNAQGYDIEDPNLVNATGNLQGDVVGSVFADDSSVMVNALDFAMFSDTITLTPLGTAPENVTNGMIAISDGITWDPLTTGVQTLMVYLGGAWRQIQTA
jgi:hypothetical protein